MPAQVTHILAGEAILKALEPLGLSPFSGEAQAWFRLGCQGPDLFYHNQRTRPSALHFGALAHKRDFGTLVEGVTEFLLSLDAPDAPQAAELRAFFLGFASHAAVDRVLHPFIVYFSGWFDPRRPETADYRACHPFMERLVDLALLEKRGHTRDYIVHDKLLPLDRIEASPPVLAMIKSALAAGLRKAYPLSTSSDSHLEERLRNTFLDAAFFYRATDPARKDSELAPWLFRLDEQRGAESMGLLYPPSLPMELDIGNTQGLTWLHPAGDGRQSQESLEDLFSRAVQEGIPAVQAMLEAFRRGRVQEGFAELLGRSSLSINDPLGKTAQPLVSAPFPLKALMLGEFRRRKAESEGAILH